MKFFKISGGKDKQLLKKHCLICFQALSVPARFRLFTEIKKEKEINVDNLTRRLSISQPTVTFHLKMLSKAGLITKKKIGREVHLHIRQFCEKCFLFE